MPGCAHAHMLVCQNQQFELMSNSPMEKLKGMNKPEMSKPQLLEASEEDGSHQRENPEYIWNPSVGAVCTSLSVCHGGYG